MAHVPLRSNPETLSFDQGRRAFGLEIWTNGDFSDLWKPTKYIHHPCVAERFQQREADPCGRNSFVTDAVTELMWEKVGSDTRLSHKAAAEYVDEQNLGSLGGYRDWRLPTVPELMSLLQDRTSQKGLYSDAPFEELQWSYWSADRCESARAWHVNFVILDVSPLNVSHELFVRAVRSIS